MKMEQSCKIWTLSANKAEYDRFSYLLEKPGESGGIASESLNDLLRTSSAIQLQGEPSVVVIHDPCDIRKPHSKKLEHLDKVRSLDGKMIPGYHSFNSVALGADRIHLLGCSAYSTEESDYQSGDWPESFDKKDVAFSQMQAIREALKAQNSDQVVIHLFDREADDQEYFEFVDKQLEDKFVFRLKLNRNSDVKTWDAKKQKEVAVKLVKKPLDHCFTQHYEYFKWRGKSYKDAKAQISYERMFLGQDYYWVVKIELLNNRGKAIFKDPMVLVTNYEVTAHQMATYVYHLYLKRSKIEGVFKFLKTELGWEQFQVRDFLAIKHIILLCYFIGGYFYEIQSQLTDNEFMAIICRLAKGKGKVTRHFFMKGLIILAYYQIAKQFFEEHKLTQQEIDLLLQQLE